MNNNSNLKSNDFDLDDFRPDNPVECSESLHRGRMRYAEFLKGPISWAWIRAATKAGRNALFVGLSLHRYRDLRRKSAVQISLHKLGDGVLSRQAVRRILRQLEAVGLIAIKRTPGSLLTITISEIPDDSGTAGTMRD
jgi:hypothetical protein